MKSDLSCRGGHSTKVRTSLWCFTFNGHTLLKTVRQDNGSPCGFRHSNDGLADPALVFGQFQGGEKDSSHYLPDITIAYLVDQ
jgi:hypothetical protein